MRVISYNLHKGRDRRGHPMLDAALGALQAREPDLLLCQEVFHARKDANWQVQHIAERLGHSPLFGPNKFYRRGCHGNATFTRLPVAEHVNIDVSESFFEKRGILHATLSGESGPFEVLNVHFSLTGRQRRRQWFKLQQALSPDRKMPVVIAGDFNDWGGALDRRARQSGALANAMWTLPRAERRTFPASRPVFALDRIYYRGFRVRSIEVLRGEPWTTLSDHLPIEAVLEPLRTPDRAGSRRGRNPDRNEPGSE